MKDFISDEEEKFYELSEDTINLFKSILEEKSIPFKIDTAFVGSVKLKKLIEIKKLSDIHSHLLGGKEMIVTVNEDLLARMDDDAIAIQFEEAINGIEVNLSSGKIKISKPKLVVDTALVKKYGIENILRAHNLLDEVQSQKKDMEATA
jgi:hypothetical protein